MFGFTVPGLRARNSLPASAGPRVQGTLLDTPPGVYKINQGMWNDPNSYGYGGMGVTISLPLGGMAGEYNSVLQLATAKANLCGFTVFNQATAMVQTPQGPVPLAADNMSINYVELGSDAHIVVACTEATGKALLGGPINQPVYWDYSNQVLSVVPIDVVIPVQVVDVAIGGNSLVVAAGSTEECEGFAVWDPTGFSVLIEV